MIKKNLLKEFYFSLQVFKGFPVLLKIFTEPETFFV